MEKIDRRRHYIIVLDTETANGLDDPLVYDIGWAVVDTHGKVYKTQSFVCKDIFLKERDLMHSAYYAKKIPNYCQEIREGKRQMRSWYEIRSALWEDIKLYEVKEIAAHNARFDYRSTAVTQRWLTKSKYRYFFPYGIEIWDTLKMAKSVIGEMPTYRKFCIDNGYTYGKNNNQLRFTAEILYRFITKDNSFIENHTGLEDVMIEKEILAYCYRQHKKMLKKLWENS